MNGPIDSVRIALFDIRSPELFLLVTEDDDPENWKLPGGKFEIGDDGIEIPIDAARRELLEEVGLGPSMMHLRQAQTLPNEDGVSTRYIFAGLVDANVVKPTEEIAEAYWFTEETVPECKNRNHILGAVAVARQALEPVS